MPRRNGNGRDPEEVAMEYKRIELDREHTNDIYDPRFGGEE